MDLADAIALFKKLEATKQDHGGHSREWQVSLTCGGTTEKRWFEFGVVPLVPDPDWATLLATMSERKMKVFPSDAGLRFLAETPTPGG